MPLFKMFLCPIEHSYLTFLACPDRCLKWALPRSCTVIGSRSLLPDLCRPTVELEKPQIILQLGPNQLRSLMKWEKQQAYMYPELQTDTVETVVVTEVTSPFRIFCQLKVFSQELKKLTEQITQHYEGRVGCNFARPENLGSPCASRGNDSKWYRSVLQQVMSANNVVEILQVDYGKKQFVQVENVQPLAQNSSGCLS